MGKKIFYYIGKKGEGSIIEEEFEISIKRSVSERVSRGFIKTYKPVMDALPYRIFNSIQEYKNWCNKKLPRWLGYGKAR